MNIITHEAERIRELQRQLHDADQFRALVTEMRQRQRRYRARRKRGDSVRDCQDTRLVRDQLEAAVDRELRLLESE